MQKIEGPVPQFNPQPKMHKLTIGNEERVVLVIDDFLLNPYDFVGWASHHATFEPPVDTSYPGILAPLTRAMAVGTLSHLHALLAAHYGLPYGVPLSCTGNYSLITLKPEALSPLQMAPHFDAPTPFRLAMLLYLFQPPQKGTGFYRHIATGYETIDSGRLATFMPPYMAELQNRADQAPAYFDNVGEDYVQIARVGAVFNRLVVYPSYVLHSALVAPNLLSESPQDGRLTVNMFVQAE